MNPHTGKRLALILAVLALVARPAAAQASKLSFEERVKAQRAIEQVYWNHRTWPDNNGPSKPALASVFPDSALRAKIEKTLAGSATPAELQAEMNRMAAHTRDSRLLRELFDALGNDPWVIAETLARQTLFERRLYDHAAPPAGDESIDASVASYTLPPIDDSGCVDDTWQPTRVAMPDPGQSPSAVWTGTEMIVWGAMAGRLVNEGGRYNPATDSWALTSRGANVPSARRGQSAVWTGTEMIVWGGIDVAPTNSGGRYNPASDTWTLTSTGASVPAARSAHTAVWTGTQMIVWGGTGATVMNSGGLYTPATDTWVATGVGANVPAARSGHTAVWTGTQMVVWGGLNATNAVVNSGGRYTPGTDTWLTTSTAANNPATRQHHTAVWTGTLMVVWGGEGDSSGTPVATGGRYNPSTNAWTATSTGANVPAARTLHTAVWSGTEMIVWGGTGFPFGLSTGGRYNPTTNAWTATSTGAGVPDVRYNHVAVWTGSTMIVWGGVSNTLYPAGGGRYTPSTDSWQPTSTGAPVPVARYNQATVWTGAEMIVWGGIGGSTLASGGRYTPATDSWAATSTGSNLPSARYWPSGVWTGSKMILWGGADQNGNVVFNSGALYDVATDTWTPTSMGANLPGGRSNHAAVWTGSEMIVWGGHGAGGTALGDGARYDPVTNSWRPMSSGAGVPAARTYLSSVWTGSELIVWGGIVGGSAINTGARYNPASDSWQATSLGANVPSARFFATTVWTGTEMIVWGGRDASNYFHDGGRYDPASDTWALTSTGSGVPSARVSHSALWSGRDMIVWGGSDVFGSLQTGGRYDPWADSWTATSLGANVPGARGQDPAIWTGTEMIVWGGYPATSTGGRYCGCSSPVMVYRDADGDGFGNAAITSVSCDGTIAAGWAANGADCNDASAAAHPGAAEICDGLDNDCNGTIDDAPKPAGALTLGVSAPAPGVARLSWTYAASDATAFDVVRGDLLVLRGNGGDFTAATQSCLSNGLAIPPADDTDLPAPGTGFWYLARPENCGGRGTYDSGASSQQGARDAEIAASGNDCTQ